MPKVQVFLKKKILIIGGAGFIGSWLSNFFLKLGHQVVVIDPLYNFSGIDKDFFDKIVNFRKKYLLNGANIYHEDYLTSGKSLIKDFKPNIVINLAAIPIEGSGDSEISKKQIIDSTIIAEAVASDIKSSKVDKYIFLSSIFAYGDINDWSVTEKAKFHPKTPYGISKAIGELITKAYLTNWNIVRTTSVYGFGDANLRVAQIFVNKALKNESFWVNKEALLDFTYVKDLVEGIATVALSNILNEDFHVTSGRAILLPEFVEHLKTHFPKIKFEVRGQAEDRPQRGTMDITKIRVLLNWSPKFTVSTGLKDYIKYAKKFGFG